MSDAAIRVLLFSFWVDVVSFDRIFLALSLPPPIHTQTNSFSIPFFCFILPDCYLCIFII